MLRELKPCSGSEFLLSLPLFVTVFAGYLIALLPPWRPRFTAWGARVVFGALLPALLFHKLSDLSSLRRSPRARTCC
ncbi:MAG TPA: hypothetical protein VJR89_28690 [Polyangiales bacterium]|nr:hypothetical protein [Polyangiales bacterium]